MRTSPLATLAVAMSLLAALTVSAATDSGDAARIQEGKAIAFDRSKGNCLSCHAIEDGELAGNSGPPLIAMQQRFSDRKALRSQIWDATQRNPQTMMPPFGKHGILTPDELEKVVDYIYSL